MSLRQAGVGVLAGGVFAIPSLAGFGVIAGWWWFGGWTVLFIADRAISRLRRGSIVREFAQSIRTINGSLAGTIDNFSSSLNNSHDGMLREETAKGLCVALLSRAKAVSSLAMGVGPGSELRATLAVPYSDGGKDGVRVWCYDQPYHGRRYSFFPRGTKGAAAAFEQRYVQIVDDVSSGTSVTENASAASSDCRSVVCIPVFAAGQNSDVLGVLNVDAPEVAFFDADAVNAQLLPLIAPIASFLGLVLRKRRPEEAYEFPR